MFLDRRASRTKQAFPSHRGAACWLAALLLLLCALLAPAATFAAPPAKAPAAPRGQGTTFERWVDGIAGSDDDQDETQCTREPNEDNEDEYVYHSCATITKALEYARPGDIIRVVGGLLGPTPQVEVYPGNLELHHHVTIIGGYTSGFGHQIEPPRFDSLTALIQGEIVINGTIEPPESGLPLPPAISGEGPMEVRLESIAVTIGGINVRSDGYIDGDSGFLLFPNVVNVTLEDVTVSSVLSGSGIHALGKPSHGFQNKVTIANSTIGGNNNGSTGGGIFAGDGAMLTLGEGTIVRGNSAANGGGIGASNAATITVSSGVTIANNSATNGGGIYATGSVLDIGSGTYIANNSASVGAGVYLNSGTNKISGAIIDNNGSSATSKGGGIYAKGSPTLENLEIMLNDAQEGGGIYFDGVSGGLLSSSTLMSNTATSGGGGYFINGGAGLSASSLTVQGNRAGTHGGGAYVVNATSTSNKITIQGNDFTNNDANNNGGGLFVLNSALTLQSNTYTGNDSNSGGGLYLEQSGSTIAGSSTFNGNTANFGAGLYLKNNNGAKFTGLDLLENHSSQRGGGLYADSANNVTIGSASFLANTSDDLGAGLYAIGSTLTFTSLATFNGNNATGKGGGAYAGSGATLSFQSIMLLNNEASDGGGFYAEGGSVTATGVTDFIENKAISGSGGALYLMNSTATSFADLFASGNTAASGGAIYADNANLVFGDIELNANEAENGNGGGASFTNSTVTTTGAKTGVLFLENRASQAGGGIYATSTNITLQNGAQFNGNKAEGGNGGGLYLTGSSSNTASLGAATFFENIAAQSGGGLYANAVVVTVGSTANFQSNSAQAGDGGGFYVSGSSLVLGGVTFQSNRAFVSGGGGYLANGALSVSAGTLLDDNRAQTAGGGGFAVYNASTVLVEAAQISNNIANSDGGALHITNSPLTVQNGATFNSNTATAGRGGAIYVSGSNSTLANLTFSKNKAGSGGGALHITTGLLSLTNSTFNENDGGALPGTGGGAYLQANSATVSGSAFTKNLATSGAGLYLAKTPAANLTSLQFIENNSSGHAGGIYFESSKATLAASTVRGNQASGEGGAIYALYSDVDLANVLIAANKLNNVANYAAGIYLSNSLFDVTHATFANNTHNQLQGSAHAFYVAPPVAAPGGAPAQSSLSLINTIVSGQAVGVNLREGNNATFNSVLWNNDHFNWTGNGNFSVTRSRRGDPRFVSVASNDFHLRRDSAAFDLGIATSVTTDLDGVARAQSLAPDLGAYEHRYSAGLYLTTSISTPFVRDGESLTIRLRVRNQSASAANAVILRATLPTQLPVPTISQGGCQGIFCEANLESLAPGADVTVEINVAVDGAPLSNGLLTLLTNVTLQTANFTSSDTAASVLAYLHGCRAELNSTIYNSVQEAMNNAASGQTIRISGVCGDVHQNGGPGQLLTINKDVTLQGGWNSDFTTLNAIAFPTYLDSAGLGRVLYIDGNVAPALENLIIRNGTSSALGGGPAGKDAGGGVYIHGGTPVFKNTDIANNQSPDLGGGVYLATPNVVNFQSGFVRNNIAGERGGGLYIDQSAPIFTGVNIVGNTARGGGGVYLYRSPAQFLDSAPKVASGTGAPTCRIDTNTSTVMPNYVPGPTGGGLPVLWLAPGGGGGILLDESAATIRGCAITGNTARVGGGAYIHNSAAFIENSLFTANLARQPVPTAVLTGPGGVRDGDGGGIVLDNQDPAAITLRGLLLGNNQGVRGSGMLTRLARGGTLTLPHFTINTNSGGSAIFALGESNLAFFNTIVVANTGGAAIFAQNGSGGEIASITLDHTLFHPPTQTKTGSSNGGSVSSATEFSGDPAIKNDGYHLKRISFAYNAGANTFSFADRDGNARPVGGKVELGADEYATAITMRYVAAGGPGGAPCDDYRSPCSSLQTALNASSNGDYIKIAGGSYSSVRNDGGRVHHALVAKSVTIEGGYFPRTDNNAVTDGIYTLNDWEDPHPVEAPTVIDVNDQGRAFFISGEVAPTFSFLTLRRGNALNLGDGPPGSSGGAGGAVYVDGASPIFKNVLVEDSRALFGSGFYLRNAGGTYTGVTALENGSSVANGRGGAFYIEGGQPSLQNMTIQSNVAITGAGLYLDNSAATLLQNTIQNNGNSTTLDGGGLYLFSGTANLDTNTIAGNQAQHGGGLRLDNSSATLSGNSINNNRAGTNPAPAGQSDGLGGGLYVMGGAPQISANTFSNNQAVHPALSYGGGLYVAQTAMALTGNTINGNQAHRGGGIYFASTTAITVQNNTIANNSAQAPNENLRPSGGGVYFATAGIDFTGNSLNQNSALYGAGIYVLGGGQSEITQNTLSANSAGKDGGGIYLDGSDAILEGNTLQANLSTGGRGGAIYARNGQAILEANSFADSEAALEGGAIFLSNDGTTLQGGSIQGSLAGDGGAIYIDGPAPGAAQPAPWINQVELAQNNASNHGGALFIRNSGAQITLNLVRNNQAAVDGGGVYIQQSTLAAFSGNVIRDNQAGDQGGGLFLTRNSSGRYHSNAIIGNSAAQAGGIFVGGASPVFVHTTLAGNGSALVAVVQDGNPTTVVLSNTIVSQHNLGIQGESGVNVSAFTTLWHAVDVDFFGSGNLSSNNNFGGNPNFLADGYHIAANSAAAGKGMAPKWAQMN
jgi:predicted outer membrane repeat protein